MRPKAGPACHAPCPALLDVAVGKTNVGPMPINQPDSRLGQGIIAISNSCISPNSVRLPPLGLGTVTTAKVGRTNWTKGSRVKLGLRGMIGRMITWLV